MKKFFNEGNQIHNFMSSSGTVINYGSGSDFLTNYGSGSGSTSQKVTVPTVPVPQHWFFAASWGRLLGPICKNNNINKITFILSSNLNYMVLDSCHNMAHK